MSIKYLVGDAANPDVSDGKPVIIAHIVNDVGAWGSGFVMALSKRWPVVRDRYRSWYEGDMPGFKIGGVQLCNPEPGFGVANMIAQYSLGSKYIPSPNGPMVEVPAIRYDGLAECLDYVGWAALNEYDTDTKVVGPRFGTQRSGGSWKVIEPLIEYYLCRIGVEVEIYDLPEDSEKFTAVSR